MKSILFQKIAFYLSVILVAVACNDQLDLKPVNDVTSEKVYATPEGYLQALAKVYGSFATTGSGGPGSTDLPFGGDPGWSDFYRSFWKVQELSTDEAIIAWNDPGLPDFHNLSYTPNNPFVQRIFSRPMFQIVLCNEFIRECADNRLERRGITGTDAAKIKQYQQEARFLRAFQYWVLLDLFRNPPFVTEKDDVGKILPRQTNARELYNYIESELLDLSNGMEPPMSLEYGHADRGAAWALLARLSLNAEVYIGEKRHIQAMEYAQKVIDAGYSLTDNYQFLFRSNNDSAGIRKEFIFTIRYDGINTQTYGGGTFIVNASASNETRDFFGISGNNAGWSGMRTTRNLPLLFPDTGKAECPDKRAQFYTADRDIDINSVGTYSEGWLVAKYRNTTTRGENGKNRTQEFCDIDVPLFRLGEMYLIYAEADWRNGGANKSISKNYINELRKRAYGGVSQGQITEDDITEEFLIAERGRELYWEGHRRTDLIRFNRFTEGSYLWPWKGGQKGGVGASSHLRILPIPANEIGNNPNLKQNPIY